MTDSNETDKPLDGMKRGDTVGELRARREQMADGRRYIIYYSFDEHDRDHQVKRQEGSSDDV